GGSEARCVWEHDKRIEELRVTIQEETCHQIPLGRNQLRRKTASIEPTSQRVHLCPYRLRRTPQRLKTRDEKAVQNQPASFISAAPHGDVVSIYRTMSKYRHYYREKSPAFTLWNRKLSLSSFPPPPPNYQPAP